MVNVSLTWFYWLSHKPESSGSKMSRLYKFWFTVYAKHKLRMMKCLCVCFYYDHWGKWSQKFIFLSPLSASHMCLYLLWFVVTYNQKKRCSNPSELLGGIKCCQINSFTSSSCPPLPRLTLTPRWSTWCPSWAAWTTAFTTHCCWRSEPWPTGTRLYLEAAGKTSTGWATPSLLLPDCWGGGWRTTRPWTAGQRPAEGSRAPHSTDH